LRNNVADLHAAAVLRRWLGAEGEMPADWSTELRRLLTEREVDLDPVLRLIVDEATRRLEADRGTLYLIDHARHELVSRIAHLPEIAEIRLRVGEGVAGWVAETGTLLNVPRGTSDPRFTSRIDAMTGYRTTSLLAAPVRAADGAILAVLQVLNKRGGSFEAEDERHLIAFANQVTGVLESTSLRSQLRPGHTLPLGFRFNHIVGESATMNEVFDRTARAARTDATVLVRGESGSGKELIARAIHFNSARKDRPFVKVDCAALPENLIENELFGHERGAFTGADRQSEGKVQAANGGTLFLDEVGELSPQVQSKLLRLLQERSFFRVGGNQPQSADVRFVCATHRDLERDVADRKFRQDLYYRLRVVEIRIPSLRDRGPRDLDRLIDHFTYEHARKYDRGEMRITADTRARLHAHPWPGNVRELEHCLESAVVMAPDNVLTPELLPIDGARTTPGGAPARDPNAFVSDLRPLREVERDYVAHVLAQCGGNRSEAARRLGIGRNTLLRKLAGED
jgi:Nif-specific regulatory protein